MPCVAGTTEGHVGGGVPPLKTDRGWLIIYHGRRRANGGEPCYEGWAALVDYREPWTSIRRSREPILTPFETGESDVIPNVAFPTGAVMLDDGTLEVYLGVNDTVTAVARADLDELLDYLSG